MRPDLDILKAPMVFAAETPAGLVDALDIRQVQVAARIAARPSRQAQLGQFLTPAPVARFMAGLLVTRSTGHVRILDPGAGTGVLAGAAVAELVARPKEERPRSIHVTAWELDAEVQPELRSSLRMCESVCQGVGVLFEVDIRQSDFILQAAEELAGGFFQEPLVPYDIAIMNPPYRKLRSDAVRRARLSAAGIETSNLYAAFVWLSLKLLKNGGELVAITPRSFTNGAYFRPFRAALQRSLSFRRVHIYESRNAAFAADDVLQENVVLHGVKGGPAAPIEVTTSQGPLDSGMSIRRANPSEVMRPDDPDHIMHLAPDDTDAQIRAWSLSLPQTLEDLDVAVSTGRVVDFRTRPRLRQSASEHDAPLIFASHLSDGFAAWPNTGGRKPNGLATEVENDPLLMPAGWYVLVKRFSAKEERRRVVAALYDPSRIRAARVAFDNKLNVLHRGGAGLPETLAKGLAVFLNSTAVDLYFRQFSGHTQVNARDLRSLRFPAFDALERLGSQLTEHMPDQDEIDRSVGKETPMNDVRDPVAAKRRIQEALEALKAMKAPEGQRNDRSALTLLGLLDLGPGTAWDKANSPRRGVTELMGWMSDQYGKTYAPNTRETIRRFTLHQFIEMGLVNINPDDPTRSTNSPKNVYQIEPSVLALLRTYGSETWEKGLGEYLESMVDRNRMLQKARKMEFIDVNFPDGKTLKLSPGGQNVLVKEIIEQFAPRFTPGGHLVYVGDTAKKYLLYDEGYLAHLGVAIEPHGRMPDVVVHDVERDWLVLIEAVTSHGPVNLLRHNQLKDLFAGSRAGLVFVTTFLDRGAMREYLPEIAWETEVWVADAPDHLIHFDGERFLGPYGEA